MNAERLLKVCEVLSKVPAKKFDLAIWIDRDRDNYGKGTCGTVACAIGWAAQDPWFKRRGLRLNEYDLPKVRGFDNTPTWDAISAFFDIDVYEVQYLFLSAHYVHYDKTTKYEVIERIKKFVATKAREVNL